MLSHFTDMGSDSQKFGGSLADFLDIKTAMSFSQARAQACSISVLCLGKCYVS